MIRHVFDPIAEFLRSEALGGIVLIVAAASALFVANSPLAPAYFDLLHLEFAGLSVAHWINDGLMAIFFLLVGLEIKREFAGGELATWPARILPAFAALGGMAAPALIYVFVNRKFPENLGGWAVPTATDIAFALGVLMLLGKRVPASLKVFLAALAILDDLGAVLVIAFFYTHGLEAWALAAAGATFAVLLAMNRAGVVRLAPYLAAGAALWCFTLQSGVHATVAGVALALAMPHSLGLRDVGPIGQHEHSPLEVLEHFLQRPVAFAIVPLFGFANAGVALAGIGGWTDPVLVGVAAGLFFGKQIGVFAMTLLALTLGFGERPRGATLAQIYGVSLLCGVGFTMSLFIGFLAFPEDGAGIVAVKLGVLAGSVASALAGAAMLLFAGRAAEPG